MDRVRYTDEDKDGLRQLIRDNAELKVSDLLTLALKAMPDRTEPAMKQQLFKLKRELESKKKKAPAEKAAKAKVSPAPVAQPSTKKPMAPPRKAVVPSEGLDKQGYSEITIHLGEGTTQPMRVMGPTGQIADLIRSLSA